MAYKRILTIQDISCIGQCSMTVAMPILSATGHETCILPTALLSSHTGGFGKPVIVHFDGVLSDIWHHWRDNNITFDAILVGYLGSIAAVDAAIMIRDSLLAPGGICIVDPAMADHGKLYSGFDEAYVEAVGKLCRCADILLPNPTEAAMLTGMAMDTPAEILLNALENPCVILTGTETAPGKLSLMLREGEMMTTYTHDCIDGNYHGTGDIFAACFTGVLMHGLAKEQAMTMAANFTQRCIEKTREAPAHWYGVKFEEVLPELTAALRKMLA